MYVKSLEGKIPSTPADGQNTSGTFGHTLFDVQGGIAGLNVMLTSTPAFQLPFVGILVSVISFLFRGGKMWHRKVV